MLRVAVRLPSCKMLISGCRRWPGRAEHPRKLLLTFPPFLSSLIPKLPNLQLCSHLFRVTALVDISPKALEHASSKFHIPRTYTDVGAMLAEADDIDVVMITSAE